MSTGRTLIVQAGLSAPAVVAAEESDSSVAAAVVLVLLAIGAALYFLPSIIAMMRRVPNIGSVIVLNLFLGWTLVGWVVSMSLAMRSRPQPVQVLHYYGNPQAMPAQQPMQAPAGWYPDPSGSGRVRYFDGRVWTDHIG